MENEGWGLIGPNSYSRVARSLVLGTAAAWRRGHSSLGQPPLPKPPAQPPAQAAGHPEPLAKMPATSMSKEDLVVMMNIMDADGSGELDRQDVLAAM